MMKIVVWKDGSYQYMEGPTWEYENDADWLVTISVAGTTVDEQPEDWDDAVGEKGWPYKLNT